MKIKIGNTLININIFTYEYYFCFEGVIPDGNTARFSSIETQIGRLSADKLDLYIASIVKHMKVNRGIELPSSLMVTHFFRIRKYFNFFIEVKEYEKD